MPVKLKKLPKNYQALVKKYPECKVREHGIGEDGRMRTLFLVSKKEVSVPFVPHKPLSQKELCKQLGVTQG